MKPINNNLPVPFELNIKELESGNIILAFDADLFTWVKCRIHLIGTYTAILEYIEGKLQGVTWLENLETLKNPDYYKMAG